MFPETTIAEVGFVKKITIIDKDIRKQKVNEQSVFCFVTCCFLFRLVDFIINIEPEFGI